MKKLFSLVIVIALVAGLLSGCSLAEKPYSNYTEVCDTSGYYPADISLLLALTNFSVGSYGTIYGSFEGSVCKFLDTGELRITYADTIGFSAPYFYDGYIYAVFSGCLYQIDSSIKGTITQIGENMDGTGANCVAVNDSFALITLHHYDENGKFSIKLMRVDLATGKATELALGSDQRIYCSAGGVMYVYTKEVIDREEVYSLYEIPAEGKSIYICDMTDVGAIPRFVLEEGVFYYADQMGDLCAKSLITGDTSTCVSGAGIYDMGQFSETGMTFSNGNIIYYNANTCEIESAYVPELGFSNKKVITIVAPEDISMSHINLSKLSTYTDVTVKYSTLSNDNMSLKILAGDSDVDIYFISATTARTLLDKNIYTPIESEIITAFNNSCFDYIAEACLSENGDIALVPISSSVHAVVYPFEAAQEVGFAKEDLLYYDSFIQLARNHGSDRIPFQSGEVIYEDMHAQYTEYYCDLENGEFDYTTDLYKTFYKEMLSYSDYDIWEHDIFVHPSFYIDERHPDVKWPYDAPDNYSDITLFSAGLYEYYWRVERCPDFFEAWGAVPIPKLSEQVKGNYVSVEFAYINPYSKNKEAAVEVLEAIAQNHMELRNGMTVYSFLLEDKTDYADDYHPQSQVFSDFYDIAANGFIFDYYMNYTHRNDKKQFGKGLITVDEAVEMYQREVEIWLNE